MSFGAWRPVLYLLTVGLASSCIANVLLAAPSDGWVESLAQQHVTVEDVQRILTEDKGAEDKSAEDKSAEDKSAEDKSAEDKSKSDARVARELSGLELTERMSSAKLKSLEQNAPGPNSRLALVALADASVFLSPAAADVVSEARPALGEQRHMLALTVAYLAKTLPKLPNFYATRTIVRFEEVQSGGRTSAALRNHSSWRHVGGSKVVVAYRDGSEVINPREWGQHPRDPEGEGLITRGTFGPILSVAFVDAVHSGGFSWIRWERESAGTAAVFRYRVPKEHSHYSVAPHGFSSDKEDAVQVTGYHGEMAIDPATGTILRLTVQADQPLGSSILQSDIMVEYGPVEIGGKTYTCPVRSVSMGETGSMGVPGPFDEPALAPDAPLLNDMTFENYHQFRSESRILTGNLPAPAR